MSVSNSSPGVFNQTVNASVTGFGNDTVNSTASQSSNVPATGSVIMASGSASFYSTITNGSTGNVYNFPPTNDNFPNSTLSMLFTISTPQQYTATITLSSSLSGNPGLFANTDMELIAYAPDNGPVFAESARQASPVLTGLLSPGTYELGVFSEVGNESLLTTNEFVNSAYNVSLQIASVPEPGSIILLTVGAIGLVGWAWGRRQS